MKISLCRFFAVKPLLHLISEPTVLVLGAGASRSYGFPTGAELRDWILYSLLSPENLVAAGAGNPTFEIGLLLKEHPIDEIRKFRSEFEYSSRDSIDFFLRENKSLRSLGKKLIAVGLIAKEDEAKIFATRDWYQYLLNYMLSGGSGIDTFNANKLSIITFNYDRSLEHFFFRSLRNGFETPDAVIDSALSSVPIHHVHGSLGHYLSNEAKPEGVRPYEVRLNDESIASAAGMIQIFCERWNERVLERPRLLLQNAARIGFLGFGYEPTNLRKLFVEKGMGLFPNARRLAGTTLGLPPGDKEQLASLFDHNQGVEFKSHDVDCLSFLKDTDFLAPL